MLSADEVMKYTPSGLNTAEVTASLWHLYCLNIVPVDTIQMITVPSSEDVRTLVPSGLNEAEVTALL